MPNETYQCSYWQGWCDQSKIRVPYLTKEQIEGEGWKINEINALSHQFGFSKGNYFGVVLTDGRLVIIMADVLLDDYTEATSNGRLYLGECKDINTFRYICKLLGI